MTFIWIVCIMLHLQTLANKNTSTAIYFFISSSWQHLKHQCHETSSFWLEEEKFGISTWFTSLISTRAMSRRVLRIGTETPVLIFELERLQDIYGNSILWFFIVRSWFSLTPQISKFHSLTDGEDTLSDSYANSWGCQRYGARGCIEKEEVGQSKGHVARFKPQLRFEDKLHEVVVQILLFDNIHREMGTMMWTAWSPLSSTISCSAMGKYMYGIACIEKTVDDLEWHD